MWTTRLPAHDACRRVMTRVREVREVQEVCRCRTILETPRKTPLTPPHGSRTPRRRRGASDARPPKRFGGVSSATRRRTRAPRRPPTVRPRPAASTPRRARPPRRATRAPAPKCRRASPRGVRATTPSTAARRRGGPGRRAPNRRRARHTLPLARESRIQVRVRFRFPTRFGAPQLTQLRAAPRRAAKPRQKQPAPG